GGDEAPEAEEAAEEAPAAPRPEVFRLGVDEAVEQRVRAQRAGEMTQDALAAIRRWIELFAAALPATQLAQDECPPPAGVEDQAEEPAPARPAGAAGALDPTEEEKLSSTSRHAP